MTAAPAATRIVFLGMAGDVPAAALRAILGTSADVVGVACGEPREANGRARLGTRVRALAARGLRALAARPADPVAIARARGIEAIRVRRPDRPEVAQWLKERSPDLMCITTFPYLLSADLLAIPKIGTVNLHPSLLPRHRGPAPLFWTARAGDNEGGVTVHWVDIGEDTGDIIVQEAFAIPDGMTSEALMVRVAEVGSRLMARAVEQIAACGKDIGSRPQGAGSRRPRPRPEDAAIDPAWGARRICNFVRLARAWQTPYLADGAKRRHFDEARWVPEPRDEHGAASIQGTRATIPRGDGTAVLWRRGALRRAWDKARAVTASRRPPRHETAGES